MIYVKYLRYEVQTVLSVHGLDYRIEEPSTDCINKHLKRIGVNYALDQKTILNSAPGTCDYMNDLLDAVKARALLDS